MAAAFLSEEELFLSEDLVSDDELVVSDEEDELSEEELEVSDFSDGPDGADEEDLPLPERLSVL